MVDPSRLIASATRIYGDRMDRLWGAFEPCPPDRVEMLADGVEIQAGRRTLRALYTPGHASHHVAFHDPERGTLFTGDVGGVRLQGASYVRPPTPPPDIDVEAWHASVARIRALRPRALDLTHFGRFDDPGRHFDELLIRLDGWVKWTADQLAAGVDPLKMIPELSLVAGAELVAEGITDPALVEAYELATPMPMTVNGIVRYLTKTAVRP
jgi:glyoxylase-like metal-dependent hydrolase (beta-lactamase superfamily II)